MEIRTALESELDPLTELWHSVWQDTHAPILPAELARYRTLESFRQRMQLALPRVRVAGEPGHPLGFGLIKEDELYQLQVSPDARGTGVGAALLTDAERELKTRGVKTAWLTCAIGNQRAAKFYLKNGWHNVGNIISHLPTPDGEFHLEVWRFEKILGD